MGEFFDKLRAANDELNVLDRIVVMSIGATLFEPRDAELLGQLWPDAEPMIEGATIGALLQLAYDRESAAQARQAERAATFWSHVVDAFLRMIEETAARQDGGEGSG